MSVLVAVVVLTSAATTTALAYFQALAQEAAKDSYEFLKRRLKPGDSRPDQLMNQRSTAPAGSMPPVETTQNSSLASPGTQLSK